MRRLQVRAGEQLAELISLRGADDLLKRDQVGVQPPQLPAVAGLQPGPRDPVRPHCGGAVLPGTLLFPRRPQVEVVLQQLPQHLPPPPGEQLFELAGGQPGRRRACSSVTSTVNKFTEAATGPAPGIGAYGSIGLFFLPGS